MYDPCFHLRNWPIFLKKRGYFDSLPKSHQTSIMFIWKCRSCLHLTITASAVFIWVDMESIFTSPQLAYFAKKKNGQSYFAEKPFYHGLSHVLLGCLGVHLYISTYSLFCKKWTYFAEKPSYHGPSHALLQGCFGVHLYISTIGLLCTNMDIFRRKAILSRPLSCSVGLFEDPSLHLHNWPILH